ncbi:hypothetical protein P879_07116 [Paragonimus westermani]|uniref:Uncharacterized protein n=1 Tax=Paragonimus westermani TaxID=34504 RepID=A0A8T0DKU4_9TREM|nr:hypothetical protein P879_07116 [Paragonimus westermani]
MQNVGAQKKFSHCPNLERKRSHGHLVLFTGLIVWPIGWDSVTVREVCGGTVGPYSKGNCTFGWAPLCAGFGFLLLFACALLAIAVDKSITTHEATRKMLLEGKNFVFLH